MNHEQDRNNAREWKRNSQRTARHLKKANGLIAEAVNSLHQLPDSLCPRDLLERMRLHLSRGAHKQEPTQ